MMRRPAGQPTRWLAAEWLLTAAGLLAPVPTAAMRATAAPAVPSFRHALVVVFENREQGAIIGDPTARTFAALARRYQPWATYTAVAHPSLPGYLALVSGSTHGINSDCTSCLVDARSLADTLGQAGLSLDPPGWVIAGRSAGLENLCGRAAAGRLHGSCLRPVREEARPVPLPRRHRAQPAPARARRPARAAPWRRRRRAAAALRARDPQPVPRHARLSVASGDRWLRRYVVPLLTRPQLAGSVVFVVFDEGTTDLGGGGHVAALAPGPLVRPGSRFDRPTGHYGLLRTLEDAWRPPRLGRSAQAQPISGIWR